MNIAFLIDILTIVLLSATIFYAFILNKRILSIEKNKDHLKQLLQSFSQSLFAAEKSIQKLETTGRTATDTVESQIKQASELRDDLKMLIDRGEQVADHMEKGISGSRSTPDDTSKKKLFDTVESARTSLDNQKVPDTGDTESLDDVKEKLMGRLQSLR